MASQDSNPLKLPFLSTKTQRKSNKTKIIIIDQFDPIVPPQNSDDSHFEADTANPKERLRAKTSCPIKRTESEQVFKSQRPATVSAKLSSSTTQSRMRRRSISCQNFSMVNSKMVEKPKRVNQSPIKGDAPPTYEETMMMHKPSQIVRSTEGTRKTDLSTSRRMNETDSMGMEKIPSSESQFPQA